MITLNKAQRHALYRKWMQDDQKMSYLEFRRTVQMGCDCALVFWSGMWLGIGHDGYTRS